MQVFARRPFAGLIVGFGLLLAGIAPAQDLIPERRFVLSQDSDLPGGDIASIFDTTLEACERACATNQNCTAFTFNTNNSSCFPKSGPGEPAFFLGAYSGYLINADAAVIDRAAGRRTELPFVPDWDVQAAFAQADGMANAHISNGFTAEEHLQAALEAEASGDAELASRFTGAAINVSDLPETWADYARLLLLAGQPNGDAQRSYRDRAYTAAINAYLRAETPALRHSVLVTMGEALEGIDRGRDTVQALRLAQALQPRDDTGVLLDAANGKYGFRIAENEVQSDTARPRVCVNFTEDLFSAGVDYSSFVQVAEAGLTVEAVGTRQICVEGVQHGQRYTFTFREGLPAADGQTLAKSIPITAYVRDRSPGVRFPGRAYVLPRLGGASIPVETVNTEKLDLTLFSVTDRNLLRAIQNNYFASPMQEYDESLFTGEVGAQLWQGSADVGQEVNRDVTTRLPMEDALKGLPAGIYALKAAVPGVDPYVVGEIGRAHV